MTESIERLTRVETVLNSLVEEVRKLRDSMENVGERITRLEESSKEAIPQVWKLRERVATLERDTAQLKVDFERLRQDYEKRQRIAGSRWWDVVKLALGPALGAIAGWVAATFQKGVGR